MVDYRSKAVAMNHKGHAGLPGAGEQYQGSTLTNSHPVVGQCSLHFFSGQSSSCYIMAIIENNLATQFMVCVCLKTWVLNHQVTPLTFGSALWYSDVTAALRVPS